ncbi:hypothetical protein [Paenibacillus lactis]|uniref:hypothetical protein n=1 Tax=Paenibacillus lactis TaxID=228574 RepID=UPI001B1ADFD9|nr:hypothetical protein [Paenibacillus lactis]GIO93212.1 hypothetical protein J31TS3_44390 [Paenibacillus lactis]
MTNPITPNIGLNKIDRTSPATTYFDLEKYIDQNADTVDRFAGEASQAIEALQQRLDTEARREVVLQPGLQIVNAERSAPFSLSGIKGRTLVNLLGRAGGCEDNSFIGRNISNYQSNISIDGSRKPLGDGCLKVTSTISGPNSSYAIFNTGDLQPGYYLFAAEVDTGTMIHASLNFESVLSDLFVSSGNFAFQFIRFYVSAQGEYSVNVLFQPTEIGQIGYVDNARLYTITAEENSKIDNMTPMEVAEKYPYVDSIQPVRNPYAIHYGENLLPPFNEYVPAVPRSSTLNIKTPYEADLLTTATTQPWNAFIKVVGGETYTLSYESSDPAIAYINLQWLDKNGAPLGYSPKNENGQTVQAPEDAVRAKILVTATAAGKFNFINPMLNIGSKPKPFKPREDSLLALQTELSADPVTGANADEVFVKDGQYFKLAKWRNFRLDGEQLYAIHSSKIGFKWVQFTIPNGPRYNGSNVFYMSKFNGIGISHIPGSLAAGTLPDQIDYDPGSKLVYISVSNTDSGWGDNYTPTSDEIKAYFMGWTMYDGTGGGQSPNSNQYTGTGAKWWARRSNGVDRVWLNATNILPTIQAPNWTPYQLVYQLEMPMIEPIVYEGMLTFNEGDNQIEVGTGIVLRESAKPNYYLANGNYYINNTGVSGSLLKEKVSFILRVYRNGQVDNPAKIENDVNAYGKQHVRFLPSDFDPFAAYSVTYLLLGTFPTVPFTGSYPANEKTLLEKLTDAVQQNAFAVSVLMNKKADKDAPGWIIPTLLNGWASRNAGSDAPLSYRKIEGLGVQVRGIIQLGTTGTVFFLPYGYRPEKTHFCNVMGYMQSQASYIYPYITVTPDGDFRIDAVTSPPTWLIIDTIIPL